jgi:hypothetical protein
MAVTSVDPIWQATELPFSSSIAKLLKHRGDAQPPFGHPVYHLMSPAPPIASIMPHENFFNAPFAIWFEPDQCHPVCTHELWQLLGLNNMHTDIMSSINPTMAIAHAQATPGHTGLEALFFTLHLAKAKATSHDQEDTPYQLLATHPALVLDPATTLPLPTDDQWCTAMAQDPDLHQVLATLQPQGQLCKADLIEKGYHQAWKAGQLESDDGIVYHYDEPHCACLCQLCTKVIPPSLQ